MNANLYLSADNISISFGERKLFDAALNMAMPNLTEGVNYVLGQMNLTAFVDDETAQLVTHLR